MLMNATVVAGVYCVAKATPTLLQKMVLSEFLSYIMAVGIGRKSSQLWVPVVVVVLVVAEAKPPSMSETIASHIRHNHFSSNIYSPSVLKRSMKDLDGLRLSVTLTGWMAQWSERWTPTPMSRIVGSNPTLAIIYFLVNN